MDINPDHFKLVSERWEKQPGKSVLKSYDFPANYSITFTEQGKLYLKNLYGFFEEKFGIDAFHRKSRVNLYSIKYYLGGKSDSLSIKFLIALKKVAEEYFTGFEYKSLENQINFIYHKSSPENPLAVRFPLNLESPFFGHIIGLSFDSSLSRYCFVNSNPELIFKAKSMFESFGFSCKIANFGGMQKIWLGTLATKLLELSGFTIMAQIKANNPLPKWAVYSKNPEFLSALLASIIDAEGNINKKSIRVCQNTAHPEIDSSLFEFQKFKVLPVSTTSFIYLVPPAKKVELFPVITRKPPLLLVSLQILLNQLEVESSLAIAKIYVKKSGEVGSAWHLRIFSQKNLESVYGLTKAHLIKKPALEQTLNGYTRKYVSKPGQRIQDFIKLAKLSEKPLFTSRDLMKLSCRKKKTIINMLSTMESKGIIKFAGFAGKFKKWQLV